MFPSPGEWRQTPTPLGALEISNLKEWNRLEVSSKGPNRVIVSFSSSQDGNRSSFQNVVFSSYLKFLTMDKVHNPVDLE
jgi:hypothetical protein